MTDTFENQCRGPAATPTPYVETFLALHSARRVLHIARQAQHTDALAGGHGIAFDDTVGALAREVERREREAVLRVGDGLRLDNGARIVAVVDDRRAHARPRFVYKRDASKDRDRYYAGQEAAE